MVKVTLGLYNLSVSLVRMTLTFM